MPSTTDGVDWQKIAAINTIDGSDRRYVSWLWGQDWNSLEDSAYDEGEDA